MALVLADRVLETSTSEGLGTFALAGAQTGYQTFSNGIGNGNTCYYTINGQTTEQWEVGIGTVGAGTLARTTLISSNTGSFINFVAGVKNVFVTYPAEKAVYLDANGAYIPNSPVFNGNVIISDNSSDAALRITQVGAGNALLVEDSANPDATPFVVDASGNVGIGTTTPAAKLHVSGSTKTGGILVEDSSTTAAAPAIEVIGKRSDANSFPAFAGKLLLARQNTVAAISSNMTLGSVAFGGNHTDGTLANILYPASIVGLSTGAFSSATAMPTSLLFQTGSTGVAPDTLGVTIGTERMRVSDTGVITLGGVVGSEALRATPVASAVNYVNVIGAVTTASPAIQAAGSDTNIDLTLTPKGTGVLKFGTYTAGILAQAGYITIKDAAGTTRNLLVG